MQSLCYKTEENENCVLMGLASTEYFQAECCRIQILSLVFYPIMTFGGHFANTEDLINLSVRL